MEDMKRSEQTDRSELDRWVQLTDTFEYECPICKHRERWKTSARYCSICGTRLYRPIGEDE